MKIDVYAINGTKKGSVELPKSIFEARINEGLMHQFLLLQRGNRRRSIAHTKGRGEIRGSTRKLYAQKGTGRARRGPIRSPLLRGGSKAFGPTKAHNFQKDMPRAMRRSALRSCLSMQAKHGAIVGLEKGPDIMKTKEMHFFLKKLPIELGRPILVVLPEKDEKLTRSVSNIPRVKTVLASYLNPEDVLGAHRIVFLVEAIKKAEEVFGKGDKGDKGARGTKVLQKKKTSDISSSKAQK